MKKITFELPPWKTFSDTYCNECGEFIDEGDEVYWCGPGVYCCNKECADKYEEDNAPEIEYKE